MRAALIWVFKTISASLNRVNKVIVVNINAEVFLINKNDKIKCIESAARELSFLYNNVKYDKL